MSIALFTGVGLFVTIPLWIVRCFTVQNECESYNDYVAYSLAMLYWPRESNNVAQPPAPPEAPQHPQSARVRPNIGGVPMPVRSL
jgi:hypothetical protein